MSSSARERNDILLAGAIKNAGNVILPVVFDFERESVTPNNELLTNSAFISVINPEMFNRYNPIMAKSVLLPVSELIKEAMAPGHINMFPDSDGTLRWESLVIMNNGYFYNFLAHYTTSCNRNFKPGMVYSIAICAKI
jgi:adenylate cyclase